MENLKISLKLALTSILLFFSANVFAIEYSGVLKEIEQLKNEVVINDTKYVLAGNVGVSTKDGHTGRSLLAAGQMIRFTLKNDKVTKIVIQSTVKPARDE